MAREDNSNEIANGSDETSGKPDHRIVEEYLGELKAIRASGAGVAETSYYPALSGLFNAVGRTLKPKVRCFIHLSNQGAGIPDGGLFTIDQFQRQSDGQPKAGQLPSRGAIEAKGAKPDIKAIAFSTQVKNYLATYGIVIATNLRDFMIVARGPNGAPEPMEVFSLADNEQDFWGRVVAHPRGTAQLKGDQFIEFIRRACLHNAPLANPKDVAWFLASYARDALYRVEQKKELPALQTVRSALEEALGMKFTGDKGEHFFRSTLVQTLFYGVFSAWVRWDKDNPGPKARFDWRTAEWSLHVPFIRTLYEEVAKPSRLGPLGLVEVLDWSAGVLNRVKERGEFFKNFEAAHAVQYFYEPFLEAYDPELRKELGVWYTPPEIVKYQVARVDTVLREELNLPDGLADPNVIVLDPCCGTGAYLVEVLHSIAATLREKGGDALVASDLKHAAMNRVFGFEILPAPFVVSHLQLGLMLQTEGAPLSQKKGERVGVYLTNALTGWEPPKGVKQQVMSWAELQEERDAAEHVKRDKKILVVLGNPPYNGFAGVAVEEERSLTTAYRTTRRGPAPEGQGLNDLYVRFFRMGERRIAEMSGIGIVCFISNYSWLDGRSHPGMRERYTEAFDRIWVDCLNGDKYRTGKTTPDGRPDPSMFSTPSNREGIQVGTAISLMVRRAPHSEPAKLEFRHFWGTSKLSDLLACSGQETQSRYKTIAPDFRSGYPFTLESASHEYRDWPTLESLMPISYPGVQSKQDALVVDIDKENLVERIGDYFDPAVTDGEMGARHRGSMDGSHACKPGPTRAQLVKRGLKPEYFVPYLYKPFDRRWIYWEPETGLLGRKSPDFFPQVRRKNLFLEARRRESIADWSRGTVTSILADNFGNGFSNFFPMRLSNSATPASMLFGEGTIHRGTFNLTAAATDYLSRVKCENPKHIFFHSVAVMHSPFYRQENASVLRSDWPRIPLPTDQKALEASAALGEQIAALLDTEAEVPGITTGKISSLMKTVALITKTGGGQLDAADGDLAVNAGWGHFGKEGVTMPAKGKLFEREYHEDEAKAIEAEATSRGMSAKDVRQLLGEKTCDVYLNGAAYWRNIPLNVWEYYIGGYQVIKKWLSYREDEILGRALKPDEAREVMNMARRIAAIILLQPKLDDNYRKVKAAVFDWASAGPVSTDPANGLGDRNERPDSLVT